MESSSVVLLGHNGAGKSTFINYILGYYVSVDAHPYLPQLAIKLSDLLYPLDHRIVGYAPEATFLDSSMSGKEYIDLMASLRGVDVPDFFDHVGRVGLRAAPDQKIASYSKGMKQRLLLALALVGDPQILVLDEPTSGLDPFGREEIEALLLGLAKNHQLIISTHSLDLACRLEAEVIILKEGDVAWRGRPKSQQELVTLFRNCRPKELDR